MAWARPATLVLLLSIFFQKTKTGRALRAVADDHQAALSIGIPLQHIWAIVWGVAGFVALVAGMMWGARNGVQFALTFTALKALPVLILGGFTSVPGAIVGGLIIGASEKLAEIYIPPVMQDLFDRAFRLAVVTLFPYIGHVKEGGAFQADVDEGRLHARQHAHHASHVDVAHQAATLGAFDVQFLYRAQVQHGDTDFLRRDVDEDFFAHGKYWIHC